MSLDIEKIRKDFPILGTRSYGKPLVYLDNAATTQVPACVPAAIAEYYASSCANVHRGGHRLGENATAMLEDVRRRTAEFINAKTPDEVVFTSGATASLNIIASSFLRGGACPGKNIVITQMEHHSNFVPWQQLCSMTGAELRIVPLTKSGEIDPECFRKYVDGSTLVVSFAAVSNVLGTASSVRTLADIAHEKGALAVADASQAMRDGIADVQEMGCDLMCFSGHKMMGPNGVGVLFGRDGILDDLHPSVFGGGMIDSVSNGSAVFAAAPARLEAGTPNISGIIGFGAALTYLMDIGMSDIADREARLISKTESILRGFSDVIVYGSPRRRCGCISFNISGMHHYDTAALLDRLGICARAGHHCAQPLLDSLGISGCVRISPAFYNTEEELEALSSALERIIEVRHGL